MNAEASSQQAKLSDMTELECLEFIKGKGVQIPTDYEDETAWAPFVKRIIEQVEANPNCYFAYSYTVTMEFALAIQAVVNEYYFEDDLPTVGLYTVSPALVAYELRDSTLAGEWTDAYYNYNCYAYAIRKYDDFYHPGDFSGNDYSLSLGLSVLVGYIEEDLKALGYTCVDESTYRPVIGSLNANQYAICFRIGTEDFHFMRMDDDGWYHKPSGTNPLKYNSLPSNEYAWTNERVIEGEVYPENCTYTSLIHYFTYSLSHNFEYTSNNNQTHLCECTECDETATENCILDYACINVTYHRGTCTECGYITPATECEYTYEGNGNGTHTATCGVCDNSREIYCTMRYTQYSDSKHRETCTVCGDTSLKSCTIRYTHRNDATDGHVHTQGCNVCGNIIGTEDTPCTFEYRFAGTVNGNNTHNHVCSGCGYAKTSGALCFYKTGNTCFYCGTAKNVTGTTAAGEPESAE